MRDDVVRVGLIGAGGNTRARHIPGLRAQPGVELVVVANRTVESGRRVADEFGIPRVAASWTEVVAAADVDAVCIGTWPYMHAPMTVAALAAGKHVLCEARMALDSRQAHAMLDAARRHPDRVAQIVPAPLTFPLDPTIVEMVGAGYVGDVIALDARIAAGGFPDPGSPPHWRHDRDLSGNNVMSMGIWYECLMRWVGPAATVSAVGRSVVRHRTDAAGRRVAMTIPDHVDVTGHLEQGGQMRLSVSAVAGHAPPVEIYLFGTEGTLRVTRADAGELELHAGRRGEGGLAPVAVDPAKRGAWRVEEEFVNAIRGRETVALTDFTTGVRYMEWTDAVTRSLRRAEIVPLPLGR